MNNRKFEVYYSPDGALMPMNPVGLEAGIDLYYVETSGNEPTGQDSWNPLTYSNPIKFWDKVDKSTNPGTLNDAISVPEPRPAPSNELWEDPSVVWKSMLFKEALRARNTNLFLNLYLRHPTLQPRSRSTLLDWLDRVCQTCRLQRETYYLAMDYVDRYLGFERGVKQQELQLIGISALFIAAKVEEIYPPQLAVFTFITNGACSVDSIAAMEIKVFKALRGNLTPVTPYSLLKVLLQLLNARVFATNAKADYHLPAFSAHRFVQIMRLLDLCTMDEGSLQFPYSVLATSTVFHLAETSADALAISSYKYVDIADCVLWMKPFIQRLSEHPDPEVPAPEVVESDPRVPSSSEQIQTQNPDVGVEAAKFRQQQPTVRQEEGSSSGGRHNSSGGRQ